MLRVIVTIDPEDVIEFDMGFTLTTGECDTDQLPDHATVSRESSTGRTP
jgi:hypothetical protein